MFGISPLGWLHTLGSLPAVPLALYMLIRYGRIVPRSAAGLAYFLFMLIGSTTVFLIARTPESSGIASVTLVVLLAGYGVGTITWLGRAARYLETILLSLSVFLLMVPTVSETLRRVPDGNPIARDQGSPILLGAIGLLAIALVLGLAAQIIHLRRQSRRATT